MVDSGIKCNSDITAAFNELKIERTLKCLVLKIDKANTGLEIDFKEDKTFNYSELAEKLPKDDPRFVLVDFEYETNENPPRKTSKLILFFWCPDNSKINRKVVFSSTKHSIKTALTGIQKDLQASDYSDLDYENVKKEMLRP
jgi:cofilin